MHLTTRRNLLGAASALAIGLLLPGQPETYAARQRRQYLESLRLFIASRGGDPDALRSDEYDRRHPFAAQMAEAERVEIEEGYETARPLYQAVHARTREFYST